MFLSPPLFSAEIPLAVPAAGRPSTAELTSIEEGWLIFQAAGQMQRVALGELVVWGACLEPKRTPILVMADGGLLSSDTISADKETILADSQIFGKVKLPVSALAGLVFRLPAALKDRDALFDRIAKSAGESDRLLLENGDELSGLLEKITENTINLSTNVGAIDVQIDRITAIIFNPAIRGKSPDEQARCWLGTSDGSRLLANSLHMNSTSLRFVAWGKTWTTEHKNLVFLQPLFNRVTYLSDLKPSEYHFEPFLELTWPYRPDRSVTGTWLRAGGKIYLKGIGMHSAARLTFDLDQPFQRFQAELAIDDATNGGGSVQFRVLIDGREKYTSETVRGNMKPLPISVDLKGAKRLELIVDSADRANVLDHADWLNARLIK